MIEISVVMPFFKRASALRHALATNAPYLARPDCEVVLVLDEPSQASEVIALARAHPALQWRIVGNPDDHEWRNPAPAINVGLRHARGRFVLVCSPESVFCMDVPSRFLALHEDGTFLCGHVKFLRHGEPSSRRERTLPFGSLFVLRSALERIEGYNEAYRGWGSEDDDVRRRLELSGLAKKLCRDVELAHYESEEEHARRVPDKHRHDRAARESRVAALTEPVLGQPHWGRAFSQVLLDWEAER